MNSCGNCQNWAVSYQVSNGTADCDDLSSALKGDNCYVDCRADDDQGLSVVVMTHHSFFCANHVPTKKNRKGLTDKQ